MRFHIFNDSGERLLNQSHNPTHTPFDSLGFKEARAVLVFRSDATKGMILAALKDIEEYVKKDL